MLQRRTLLAGGLALLAPARAGTAAAAPGDSAYVMGYFTESPNKVADRYSLHLAVSTDGLTWTPLNQGKPVATPTAGTGGLRDPFIMRKRNGGFVVLATDLTGTDFTRQNQYIHAWDSTDLRSFTGYRRLKMHSMPTHTWAPEAFWDASRGQYGILYSANSGGRDAFYVNYTTDFVTVSAPQLFFDPGFDVLDATMHVGSGMNYLYYKSFADGRLYGARSTTLTPRGFDRGTYTSGVVSGGIEAPIVVKAHNRDEWWLWGDSFSPVNGELYAWRSGDIDSNSWTPLTKAHYTQPLNAKHPTICGITATERPMTAAPPSPRTPRSTASRAWPTARGRRSGRTTSPTGTSGTPITSCASTRSAPRRIARTPRSRSATDPTGRTGRAVGATPRRRAAPTAALPGRLYP
ncbi:hypothetical protein FHX81_0162 [Saccharothrix saharensis]|uniref:Glycosyl hydrolase family 43 n=1 Tax=Saccharothrix saharensis TaxID=571190 RepID=A0A543J4Z8_9PSEU|nr:hypothetical protein FHX81_0162 [Saccharothrix saharensis]